MKPGELRDADHKFEFNAAEFQKFIEQFSNYDCQIRGLPYPNTQRIIG